jgi:ATP-dependent DNA helicase RecG
MISEQLKNIIRDGEGLTVEFKECRNHINRGHIVLGVDDNGNITGIEADALPQIKKDLVTALNNPQKISPPLYILPETMEIEGKDLLCLGIPESSQVHRCNGKVFDRNEDGDLDITNHPDAVAHLYIRKQSSFSENRIYPYVKLEDLRSDLLQRVRKMVRAENPDHPWGTLTDEELLSSAKLYQRDYQTGKEGYTLAAILLLGKDEVIQSVLPHFKTDAILRRVNLDRYDDRDDIRTNLIESYDRLMAFVAKHLPDPFYLEKDHRISLRDLIFREVVTNMLVHREYINHFPAKFVIGIDQVVAENANRPHGYGIIIPSNFTPYPKNPVIASFFKEIGRADELGSGVRNLYKYTKIYSGRADPQLIEGDIFRICIPVPQELIAQTAMQFTAQVAMQATAQVTTQVDKRDIIIEFCKEPKTTSEIMEYLHLANREHFRKNILRPLLENGILHMTIPEKPTSPNQKYYSNPKDPKHV